MQKAEYQVNSTIIESYSAGTETKPQINQDAVRVMKEIYGIDMEENGQYSKLIADIHLPASRTGLLPEQG